MWAVADGAFTSEQTCSISIHDLLVLMSLSIRTPESAVKEPYHVNLNPHIIPFSVTSVYTGSSSTVIVHKARRGDLHGISLFHKHICYTHFTEPSHEASAP
jgi:hypothetical protein